MCVLQGRPPLPELTYGSPVNYYAAALVAAGVASALFERERSKVCQYVGVSLLRSEERRRGDTLVVPKLDRLARSVPDARAIGDDLALRGVKLQLGASVHDPSDPMGKLFFNILATFAEFEADLIRMRTREGMAVARSKGKLRGKKPKLSERQQKELRRMYDTDDYSISDLAEVFSISRPTVYRTLGRQPAAPAARVA